MFATLQKSIDWKVEERPTYFQSKTGESIETGYKSIIRTDNESLLSVRGKGFFAMPTEEFGEIKERIGEISGFTFSGFSEFDGGKIILANFKNTNEDLRINNFKIEDNLIVGNSYNGEKPFFLGTNMFMIRCSNQFSKITVHSKVRNTANAKTRREELLIMFEQYCKEKELLYKTIEQFQTIEMKQIQMEIAAMKILSIQKEEGLDKIATRSQNRLDSIMQSITHETAELGMNAFGFFNGVTHYTTHTMESKHEAFGNFIGLKNELNQKAYNLCNQLLLETV